jgi:mono/diheme cytochrome c family protein
MLQFSRMRWRTALFFLVLATRATAAWPQSSGKQYYLADCARCHGMDGTGSAAAMREVPGYRSVDLTQLSRANHGQFPRQEVRDAIEGSKRFPAHLVGGMPLWGRAYGEGLTDAEREQVQEKIAALVDYIESIQAK